MGRVLPLLVVWLSLLLSSAAGAQPTAAPAAPKPPAEARVVIGAYINDIHHIDLATNSHFDDLYIWFRWKDKDRDPTKGIDFMNWTNAVDHSNVKQYDPPLPQPDGSYYTVLHHQGAFTSKFSLENYPFDKQMLNIELEDSQLPIAQREFVADSEPVKLDPVIHLPGYVIGVPQLHVTANRYSTTFGDRSSSGPATYSRVTITIPVERPWISGMFKVMLPIGLILVSAVLGLAVRPDHIDARIGLGITALLTMVALQFTSAASLPEVSYLMLIDKVYIASYFVIVAVLGIIVHDTWFLESRGAEAIARRNRVAIIILVIGYLAFVGFLIGRAMLA